MENSRGKGGTRGSQGVTVKLRDQSVDSATVVGQVVQPREPRLAELKGLTHDVFSERWTNLFGVLPVAETRRCRSVDSTRVLSQVAVERGESA